MDSNIPGSGWPPGGPDSYWRRRVFVLGGVLGVLGLLAWACSAATGGPRGAQPPVAAAASAADKQIAATGAARAPAPTVTVTVRPARKAHLAARAHRSSNDCAPGDVVLTLSESQQIYPAPTEPKFTIYAVNIGTRTCTLDAGPRSLRLVIKSGPVHSWGSADCARGATSHPVRLSRGVPLVKHLSWNRERSEPGCPLPRPVALPGTYTATVTYGTSHSQTDVFFLR
ncbi:MAG: hypothetical protein ACM3ML_00635 [Micromonosporaceae bacterium]